MPRTLDRTTILKCEMCNSSMTCPILNPGKCRGGYTHVPGSNFSADIEESITSQQRYGN